MNTWHKFLLQDENIFQATTNLRMKFKTFFDVASDENVKGAALLSKFHRNGAMIYFSPNASKIAKLLIEKYNASSCSSPTINEDEDGYLLSFLAGDQLFFSENFPIQDKF